MKRSQPGPNFGIGFVFVLLLCLANQLCAKCPTDSVEVRGKVECCLKPDDKVLVTLLFSGQQEASGEETAIDIHNGAFSGRVAFNTYSSSFLGGDRCHRHPESVLLRLIEANGMEKDRTSLKIASDFNYDEKQGEYNTPPNWTRYCADGVNSNATEPPIGTRLTLVPFRFWLLRGGSFTSCRALIRMLASLSVMAPCSLLILGDTRTLLKKKRNQHMSSFITPSAGFQQK
jgi:hypothetical protein